MLVESADKYIQQYFHDVSLSDEYLNLNANELLDIVKRDELHVISEEQVGEMFFTFCLFVCVSISDRFANNSFGILQVFEAIMHWVKKDSPNRKIELPRLLASVRMPLLAPHYLVDRVATEELIRTSHECRY